jgi:hypothetical protein
MDKKHIKPKCLNCFSDSHFTKQCRDPHMSVGVIPYKIVNNEVFYLCIRRKHSFTYRTLVLCKDYNIYHIERICYFLRNMSEFEHKKLLTWEIPQLWLDVLHYEFVAYSSDYFNALQTLKMLKEGFVLNGKKIDLAQLIKENPAKSAFPEWGFPKGKRNLYESNLECAIREFYEETNCNVSQYIIPNNLRPVYEVFKGTDNNLYKNIYYIANVQDTNFVAEIDKNNRFQDIEVGAIKWVPFSKNSGSF